MIQRWLDLVADTPEQAARCADQVLVKRKGPEAWTNFPLTSYFTSKDQELPVSFLPISNNFRDNLTYKRTKPDVAFSWQLVVRSSRWCPKSANLLDSRRFKRNSQRFIERPETARFPARFPFRLCQDSSFPIISSTEHLKVLSHCHSKKKLTHLVTHLKNCVNFCIAYGLWLLMAPRPIKSTS